MDVPSDPFEASPEGLEEALAWFDDEVVREVGRALAMEFGRAKLDAAAIIEQQSFLDAWRAVATIASDDDLDLGSEVRLRAIVLVMATQINRFRLGDEFDAWAQSQS